MEANIIRKQTFLLFTPSIVMRMSEDTLPPRNTQKNENPILWLKRVPLFIGPEPFCILKNYSYYHRENVGRNTLTSFLIHKINMHCHVECQINQSTLYFRNSDLSSKLLTHSVSALALLSRGNICVFLIGLF